MCFQSAFGSIHLEILRLALCYEVRRIFSMGKVAKWNCLLLMQAQRRKSLRYLPSNQYQSVMLGI